MCDDTWLYESLWASKLTLFLQNLSVHLAKGLKFSQIYSFKATFSVWIIYKCGSMRNKCPVSNLMTLTLMKLQVDRSALGADLTCRAYRRAVLKTSRSHCSCCIQLFVQRHTPFWGVWILPQGDLQITSKKKRTKRPSMRKWKIDISEGKSHHVHLRPRRERRHLHFLSSPLWLQRDGWRGRLAFH